MLKRNENVGQSPESEVSKVKMGDCLEPMRKHLLDELSAAILKRVVETGGCAKEDLVNMDTVVIESQSLIMGLTQVGLIEIQEDTVVITEKGRKVLEWVTEEEEG